jgi:putative ABC transport system permease protein
MRLWIIVSRNLCNRRMRTALTVLGIAVGMMAVISLMGLARGFENNWNQTLNARGTDAVVNRITTGNPIPGPFSQKFAHEIAKMPGVEASGKVLSSLMPVEHLPMVLVTSWEWESYIWDHLEIVEGRIQQDGTELAAMLGKTAAQMLDKKVGDSLKLIGTEVTVCGIYESTSMVEAGAILISLDVMQAHTDNEEKINFMNLRFEEDIDKERGREICREIEAKHNGLSASLANEAADHHSTTKAVKGMTLAVTLLAMIVGLASVMNTMLMSVFERTVEIGVLRAIGWKAARIRKMILLEATLLGVGGGILGVLLGFLARELLYLLPAIRSTIRIEIGVESILSTIFFATVVGVLSGLYPAIRASRMKPTVAFRHQ